MWLFILILKKYILDDLDKKRVSFLLSFILDYHNEFNHREHYLIFLEKKDKNMALLFFSLLRKKVDDSIMG